MPVKKQATKKTTKQKEVDKPIKAVFSGKTSKTTSSKKQTTKKAIISKKEVASKKTSKKVTSEKKVSNKTTTKKITAKKTATKKATSIKTRKTSSLNEEIAKIKNKASTPKKKILIPEIRRLSGSELFGDVDVSIFDDGKKTKKKSLQEKIDTKIKEEERKEKEAKKAKARIEKAQQELAKKQEKERIKEAKRLEKERIALEKAREKDRLEKEALRKQEFLLKKQHEEELKQQQEVLDQIDEDLGLRKQQEVVQEDVEEIQDDEIEEELDEEFTDTEELPLPDTEELAKELQEVVEVLDEEKAVKEDTVEEISKQEEIKEPKVKEESAVKPLAIDNRQDFNEEFILIEDDDEDDVSNTKKRKHKKSSYRFKFYITIGIIVILGFGLLLALASNYDKKVAMNKKPEKHEQVIENQSAYERLKNTYREYRDRAYVKEDYVGQIIFESGLLNEPVVQGETNDTYIQRNFETYEYEICGPVFLDSACNRNKSKNLILYGHNRNSHVDPDHIMKFSPLHTLESKEEYSNNEYVDFVRSDRVDIYDIAAVYRVKCTEKEDGNQYLLKGEPVYYQPDYSEEEFKEYKKAIESRMMYETGVSIDYTDEILTLQTCYEGSVDKLIVVAVKVDSYIFKN